MELTNIIQGVQGSYTRLRDIIVTLEETEHEVIITVRSTDGHRTISSRFPKQILSILIDCNFFLLKRVASLASQVIRILPLTPIPVPVKQKKKTLLTNYNSIW